MQKGSKFAINKHDSTKKSMQIFAKNYDNSIKKLAESALDYFYQICEIPHKSGDTKAMRDFIVSVLKQCDCNINIDKANNIHITKGKPKIAFQAHYDMVLVGKTITPIIKNGFLQSQDSSLGADNGIAVALILTLSKMTPNFEALLTNDEEIGMIGAKNLTLNLQSKMMINLDSENINEICVGSAGGFDADINLQNLTQILGLDSSNFCDFTKSDSSILQENCHFYTLQTHHFQGGHSGIDIHKNIKNAIVELLKTLESLHLQGVDFCITHICGGENRNSIPINATATIIAKTPINLSHTANISIQKLESIPKNPSKVLPSGIIPHLLSLHNGIYEINDRGVLSSLNFSLIDNHSLKLLVRANKEEFLQRHILRLTHLFGESVAISGLYNAWEREDSAILECLQDIYKNRKIPFKVIEIHAGLECGILKEKCHLLEVISIGPTIFNPHSKSEKLDLKSYWQFCGILMDIAKIF